MADHKQKVERMKLAIDGLSIGDAFGQRFFFPAYFMECLPQRKLPDGPWYYTDDTEMALAIAEVLEDRRTVDQDELAQIFARRYQADPHRGYGAGAHQLLQGICNGGDWRELNQQLFGGEGSFGNGGAMRVAPVAAYFADEDAETILRQAEASAEVTHAHLDGRAGAIATALAGAWGWRRSSGQPFEGSEQLLPWVHEFLPDSRVRQGIEEAIEIDLTEDIRTAANFLGNGSQITAQDTVPICLWAAAKFIDDYEEALWNTVSIDGDIDTNCAIVGGIVALSVGRDGVPEEWRQTRESLWRYSAPP